MRLTFNFRLILIVCTALVLSACAAAVPPTVTPPPTPTSIPPTPTNVTPPTDNFPPTWTPGPPPTDTPVGVQRTATELSANRLGPTFPPSWTPVVFTSSTPIPLPTDVPPPSPTLTPAISRTPSLRDGPPTPPRDANYSPDCVTFNPGKRVDALVYLGTSATISWTPVKGVEYYEFWLRNPGLGYVLRQQTTDTKIVIDQKVLVALGAYGWEVIAYKNKDRMCPSVTGFIRVAAPAR